MRHATVVQKIRADEEVSVAPHERNEALRTCLRQHCCTLGLKALVACVVAYPSLEEIAEDEYRVCLRTAQVLGKRIKCVGRGFAQMQVAEEVDGAPIARRAQLGKGGQR